MIAASAPISSRSMGVPEIGKFSTARCVWARHFAQAGTRTSPMESCSMRYSRAVLSATLCSRMVWMVTVVREDPRSCGRTLRFRSVAGTS